MQPASHDYYGPFTCSRHSNTAHLHVCINLYVLLIHTHSGYSDRGAPISNDTNSDEEAELQEAIRRSLSHDQTATTTPSAPPPPHDSDHNEDMQRAVEQSLADLQHSNTSDTNPPPPYNPAYNPQEVRTSQRAAASDIFEAETVIVGESEQDEGAGLRRRGGAGTDRSIASSTHRETRERQRSRNYTDMDSIRAARLRRFGGTS